MSLNRPSGLSETRVLRPRLVLRQAMNVASQVRLLGFLVPNAPYASLHNSLRVLQTLIDIERKAFIKAKKSILGGADKILDPDRDRRVSVCIQEKSA